VKFKITDKQNEEKEIRKINLLKEENEGTEEDCNDAS